MEKKKENKRKLKEKEEIQQIGMYDETKVIELLEDPGTLPIAVQMLHTHFTMDRILTILDESGLTSQLCVQIVEYLFDFPMDWISPRSAYMHIFHDRDVTLSKKDTPSFQGVSQPSFLIQAKIFPHEPAATT